ncbi:MAG: SAM-dependent methyltransferase [Acidobacteriota bacterium]|nr:SAM-dependent methyltransferase [Acidobacteriota bacterium]
MAGWFGSKEKSGSGAAAYQRVSRHSNSWGKILERMRAEESLRILDIGPTSSGNINFITSLGHSIYLANLVEDAAKREWILPEADGAARFDVDRFLATHLDFSGRGFDIVLFWDTADYLPEELLAPVLARLYSVMAPGGQLLAMFHPAPGVSGASTGKTEFHRYHLTDTSAVDVQRAGDYPITHNYTNRQIEKLLEAFKGYNFFLSKDNMREVVVTR